MKDIKVNYSSRAYAQDSAQAMGGDVIRALIELVTNCDDAYGESAGTIKIVVKRSNTKNATVEISVSDSAKGLSPEENLRSFTELGAETSGFANGATVRGLFGRGAKDTTWFGKTKFESIKNGEYSIVELCRDGRGTFDEREATPDDRKRLYLNAGQNGVTATMFVFHDIAKVPELVKLTDRLTKHVQLRQINVKNLVELSEIKNGKITQTIPLVWELPHSSVVLDCEIAMQDYETTFHLVIHKLTNQQDGIVNDYSMHGVEIRGKRATYMNTMFKLTGVGVGYIHGVVTCPKIDDLIRQFDKDEQTQTISDSNPTQLVRRDRNGLQDGHPFMKALASLVVQKIKPIIDSLEPILTESGGSNLKKDLSRLARLLGELMKEDLDEDDDEPAVGGNLPTAANPIVVIPPTLRGLIGLKRTLTVLIHVDSSAALGLQATLSNTKCSLAESPNIPKLHKHFKDVAISQIRLSLDQLGSTTVIVSALSDKSEQCSSEVIIHNEETLADKAPATLEWKNESMSVTIGKERSIMLLAPIEMAPDGILESVLELKGECVDLIDRTATLQLTTKGWLAGKIRIKGLKVSSSNKINATANGISAAGKIAVSNPMPQSGFNFDVKLEPQDHGPNRGQVKNTDNGRVMYIWTKNLSIAPYLGVLNEDGSYEHEHEPAARAALNEAIASVAADFVLRKEVLSEPTMYKDVDNVIQKRTLLAHRYLKIFVELFRAS